MTSTGPSMRGSSFGPVTTIAISMIRLHSGSRPVISQSSQTRFWSDLASAAIVGGGFVGCMSRIVADGINSPAMTDSFPASSPSLMLTYAFALMLLAVLILKFWLSSRQIRHVAQHREQVPTAFAQTISLAAHQKAADYTLAKARLGLLELAFGTAVLLGWTLLGGLSYLNQTLLGWLGSGMTQQ